MPLVPFKQLSPQEKEALLVAGIINGCGPIDWRMKPPSFFFEANCFEHDYNYAIGNTARERYYYDRGMFEAILRDVKRQSWWKRPFFRAVAHTYYLMIRWRGGSRFNWNKKPESIEEMIDAYHS